MITQVAEHVPSPRKVWVRLLRSVARSAAVGLAPYVGRARVPGFAQLLGLFPQSIADVAIISSTATMTIVAAVVEFYGSDKIPLENARGRFRSAIRYSFVLLSLLLTAYFVTVTRVPDLGGVYSDSYVTGFTGSRDFRCEGKSSAQCIREVTHADEAYIDLVFGELQIRLAKALLVFTYAGFMSTFAYVIALIVLSGRQAVASFARLRDETHIGNS